jgi:molybdopterin/thiamine biosynthesis adenylyltransferase
MEDRAQRYARQIRLGGVGKSGQAHLAQAKVAIVGIGALGSVMADLLARAGVGTLRLIDRDFVEWTNLQRQSLYTEEDAELGRPKVTAAKLRLENINREIQLEESTVHLDQHNILNELEGVDLVLDGTDNFSTRYLINDWAIAQNKPWVYAGVVGTYGMTASFSGSAPCLRCTYPEPPPAEQSPTCRSAGVLGPAVAAVAAQASAEAMRRLLPSAPKGIDGFHVIDVWAIPGRFIIAKPNPECPCCVQGNFDWLKGNQGTSKAEPLCGGNAVQFPPTSTPPNLPALAKKLRQVDEKLIVNETFLRCRVHPEELILFKDGRCLIRGTENPARAQAIRDKILAN